MNKRGDFGLQPPNNEKKKNKRCVSQQTEIHSLFYKFKCHNIVDLLCVISKKLTSF